MQIGFIGLGKMGYNMVLQLLKNGKKVAVYNRSPEKVKTISKKGATGTYSIKELAEKLKSPRIIWLMVPHPVVDDMIKEVLPHLIKGDIIVDGGNSNYKESVRRAAELKKKGISYLDVGVSGGLAAAKTGYCMMAGGEPETFKKVEPFIKSMCVPNGYGHFGKNGSGHYVKMAHNAIEYGIMQAMGEGYDLIKKGPYKDVDLLKLSNVWNNGSIIRSFLLEMAINAFEHHPDMKDVKGLIPDNGEGLWAVQESLDYKVPFTVNTYALMARFRSRQANTYSDKVVSALRDEFGGHGVAKK